MSVPPDAIACSTEAIDDGGPGLNERAAGATNSEERAVRNVVQSLPASADVPCGQAALRHAATPRPESGRRTDTRLVGTPPTRPPTRLVASSSRPTHPPRRKD